MNKRSSHVALKYSAAKLHEKGILLSIDGLPSNQFKNIQFEIVPVIAPVPGSSSSADQHHEQQVKQPAFGQWHLVDLGEAEVATREENQYVLVKIIFQCTFRGMM